jgi:cysteine desulfurase
MSLRQPIYLDYASTTPVDNRVLKKMLPYFNQYYGNASSKTHAYGWMADEAVQIAGEQIASLINSSTEEIIFTSGATESINLALRGIADLAAEKKQIISFTTEHRAVLDTLISLEKKGFQITLLNPNADGTIDLKLLSDNITSSTLMIVCMYANNETGVIYPVREIGEIAQKNQIFFFCDATQAVGKIPVDVLHDNMHMMAFSAHKIYGPKGVGGLYVRRKNPRIDLIAQITGGGQQHDRRSGTMNVPGIVGFGEAAQICQSEMMAESKSLCELKNHLEETLINELGAAIHGIKTSRLPHITNVCLNNYRGSSLIPSLCHHIAVSAGSACSSGEPGGSHVLNAMGISAEAIKKTIRISMGRMTTKEDIDRAIEEIRIISN